MHYIYYFEIAALAILFVITCRHFIIRKFDNPLSTLFSAILIVNIANITFDILACIAIDNSDKVPLAFIEVSNWMFYFTQIIVIGLITAFITTLTTSFTALKEKYWYALLPACVLILILVSNPLTNIYYTISPENGAYSFSSGFGAVLSYIHTFWFLAFSLTISIKHKNNITSGQLKTIIAYSAITVVIIPIQLFYPQFLLTGITMALAILLMSYNIQNPSDMLDSTSKVFNLRAFLILLKDACEKNHAIHLIAIDVSDVDRLANIFGIQVGGELLKQIGSFLNTISKKDWSFKIVGPRFVVATYDNTRYYELLATIRERFNGTWKFSQGEVSIFASICHGIEKDIHDPDEILSILTASLDEIKSNERGKTKLISSEVQKNIQRKFAVEEILRTSIFGTGTAFKILFQPIYDFRNNRFTGAEALIRMVDENGETIMPSEFIPIAEITGLIRKLDRLVTKNVCKFLAENPQLYELGLQMVHINLSANDNFGSAQRKLYNIVEEYEINPHRICFEITETAASNNMAEVSNFMKDMKKRGFEFAMDDFGTGYSNLYGLTNLPFKVVKFDKSLIPEDNDPNIAKVFIDMIKLIKDLGKTVVIEGIETPEQIDLAKSTSADLIQGFYYAKPLPPEDFIKLMEKQRVK